MNNRKSSSLLLIFILVTSAFMTLNSFSVKAQNELTLAETINNVVSNINSTDAWTCLYNQIFGLQKQSAFDVAITQALNASDYTDVIFIATLAQLNGYSSTTINHSVTTALKNIPMCGSLPITYYLGNGPANPDAFSVADRYMINVYRYAQEFGVLDWNITQAFLDFANAYLRIPKDSQCGEMLFINPALSYSASFTSRYYDEYAQTLSMFLMFAEAGANATVSYNGQKLSPINFADDMWLAVQNKWNGEYYVYQDKEPEIECEMGNFATIISQFQNYVGSIPDFDRVVQDLENTLLAENFSSPAWGTIGVLQHAQGNQYVPGNPQERLKETTGALIAIQMLYPYFNQSMQSNFRGMLRNGSWQGLLNSNLYSNSQFRFDDDNGTSYGDNASSLGSMLLFLDGIVPNTGYLAINASNEAYEDYRTCFPTSEWNFNYQNQSIRIPVMAGNLSFMFGSQEVTQNFPTNGVYNIQFSYDWNSILSITKIANIKSVTMSPATLKIITRTTPTPSPTPAPTSCSSSRLTPSPSIPEFPTWIILPLLAVLILFSIAFVRRKIPKK